MGMKAGGNHLTELLGSDPALLHPCQLGERASGSLRWLSYGSSDSMSRSLYGDDDAHYGGYFCGFCFKQHEITSQKTCRELSAPEMMHDRVTDCWTLCPFPPDPDGVQGLPNKQFRDVNCCKSSYHAAKTSGCFSSGWTTTNSVILARKPMPCSQVCSHAMDYPPSSRAVAGKIPTWGAGEGSKALLDGQVTLLRGVLSASSQLLRCLPPASHLSPGHSSEQDLCTAAASPGTQGPMLFGWWLVWGFFFQLLDMVVIVAMEPASQIAPRLPPPPPPLPEGLSRRKGGITIAQQDEQSTKVPSGSSREAALTLFPTRSVS